jgi:hypothetical protein
MSTPQPTFGGEKEDPTEYLEAIEFFAERAGGNKSLAKRVSFRLGLEGTAKKWYTNLPKDIRSDWDQLKAAFETRFSTYQESDFDRTFLLSKEVYDLKQKVKESDFQYFKRIEELEERIGS